MQKFGILHAHRARAGLDSINECNDLDQNKEKKKPRALSARTTEYIHSARCPVDRVNRGEEGSTQACTLRAETSTLDFFFSSVASMLQLGHGEQGVQLLGNP